MALTDTAVRTAKPKDKPYKLSDERGLFLLALDHYTLSSGRAQDFGFMT